VRIRGRSGSAWCAIWGRVVGLRIGRGFCERERGVVWFFFFFFSFFCWADEMVALGIWRGKEKRKLEGVGR
jgi:hypothetical protein